MSNIDPDNLSEFEIPQSILSQLFEFSGSNGGDSGFILAYVNQQGTPSIITKTGSSIVELGLRQAMQQYIEQLSAQEIELNFPKDPGDEETS
jgi:hypothetical protein